MVNIGEYLILFKKINKITLKLSRFSQTEHKKHNPVLHDPILPPLGGCGVP